MKACKNGSLVSKSSNQHIIYNKYALLLSEISLRVVCLLHFKIY